MCSAILLSQGDGSGCSVYCKTQVFLVALNSWMIAVKKMVPQCMTLGMFRIGTFYIDGCWIGLHWWAISLTTLWIWVYYKHLSTAVLQSWETHVQQPSPIMKRLLAWKTSCIQHRNFNCCWRCKAKLKGTFFPHRKKIMTQIGMQMNLQ